MLFNKFFTWTISVRTQHHSDTQFVDQMCLLRCHAVAHYAYAVQQNSIYQTLTYNNDLPVPASKPVNIKHISGLDLL